MVYDFAQLPKGEVVYRCRLQFKHNVTVACSAVGC